MLQRRELCSMGAATSQVLRPLFDRDTFLSPIVYQAPPMRLCTSPSTSSIFGREAAPNPHPPPKIFETTCNASIFGHTRQITSSSCPTIRVLLYSPSGLAISTSLRSVRMTVEICLRPMRMQNAPTRW